MPDPVAPDLGAIRFRRHRDVGAVVSTTLGFIRASFGGLLRTFGVVVLPVALASGVSLALFFGQVGDWAVDPEAMPMSGGIAVSYVGMLLFATIGTAVTMAAGAAYVRLYREGMTEGLTAGGLWEEARGLVLPFLGVQFLFGFVAGLGQVLAVVPCLGPLAYLAGIAWLLPRVQVTLAVRALERDSVGASWSRALDLVSGSWGFAFGSILLTGLLLLVLMIALMIPLGVASTMLALQTVSDPSGGIGLWIAALFAPVQVLWYFGLLLPLVATFLVHGRLVEELDGTTLYADLDALADETRASSAFGRPASTPPAAEAPPAEPPADAPAPDDAPPPAGGFRGGGFGG